MSMPIQHQNFRTICQFQDNLVPIPDKSFFSFGDIYSTKERSTILIRHISHSANTVQTRIISTDPDQSANCMPICQSLANPSIHRQSSKYNTDPLPIRQSSGLLLTPITNNHRKWIGTGSTADWHESASAHANRRTIPQVTRELVLYTDRLLVSTEDDFNLDPLHDQCRTCANHVPIDQAYVYSQSNANRLPFKCQSSQSYSNLPIKCQSIRNLKYRQIC